MNSVLNWIVALLNFVHLFATTAWIGGMVFLALVFMPALQKRKELGPKAAMLTVAVSKRFVALAWASIALFFITGVPMYVFNPRFPGFIDLTNPWLAAILVKHIVYAVLVIGSIAQTFIIRRTGQILAAARTQPPAERPTPPQLPSELMTLRRRQLALSVTMFILGILTLLLTAIAEAAFIPG